MRKPIRGKNLTLKLRKISKSAASLVHLLARQDRKASATLRAAMRVRRSPVSDYRIMVPHYWAPYYHDGRGPVSAKPGGFLAIYKNKNDDPRIAKGYPVNKKDVLSLRNVLDQAQFENDWLFARKLILTKRVGPAEGYPFLDIAAKKLTLDSSVFGSALDDFAEAHLTGFLDSFISVKKRRAKFT